MITRCSPIVQREAGFNRGTIRSQLNPAFRQIQRQEFRDPIDGMLGDALEDVPQVGFWIELVELGCSDERVDRRGALAAAFPCGGWCPADRKAAGRRSRGNSAASTANRIS